MTYFIITFIILQSVFSERPHMAKGDHSDDYNDIEVSNECIFWCQTDVDIYVIMST